MKHILFTDLHVGLNFNKPVWDELPIKAIEHLTSTARHNNINSIIFLGDFYHNRKELNIKVIDTGNIIASMLNEFETHIICGNHDTYYKNTNKLTSLQTIDKYKNVHIHLDPFIINDKIVLVPWGCDFKNYNVPVCMGHFDIKNFKLNDYNVSDDGEDISSFNDFELVLSGHYHTYSKQENITYIGNMYGHNFNDVNATRGYWIFDDTSLDLEFIEFSNAPKFIKVFNTQYNKEQIPNNIIKIYFTKQLSEKQINDLLIEIQSLQPLELSTDYSNIEIETIKNDFSITEFSTLDENELFIDYLDKITIPEHLNKSFCKKILKTIIKGEN